MVLDSDLDDIGSDDDIDLNNLENDFDASNVNADDNVVKWVRA